MKKRKLGFWEIWNMSFGFLGIQFGFALQNANTSRIFETHLDMLEQEIEQLFKSNKNIDGVFAVNELYALSAMKVARKLGLDIPNDIQVIGFTDGVLSKHATPSLTTVSQHAQQMGERAADLLIDKLETEYDTEEEEFQTIVIATDLVERESTK